jgi:hypothetical protein
MLEHDSFSIASPGDQFLQLGDLSGDVDRFGVGAG